MLVSSPIPLKLMIDGQEVKPGDTADVIREKVENEIRKHSNVFEWHDDRSLSVWHRVPAIRTHGPSGQTVFFGNVISAYERASRSLPRMR